LQIQFGGQRPQSARTEQRMQLFAENRFVYIAADPGMCHRTQAHFLHAPDDPGYRAVPLDELLDGAGELFARQLAPELLG